MKILLIQPAKAPVTLGGEDVFVFEPLALEYVAAGVSADHDVRILDQRLGDDVGAALETFQPDVVGLTAYTVHVGVAHALAARVKAWRPDALVVVGGHHATVAPDDFASPFIDVVVMGEGVAAFREIVSRHERRRSLRGIPGVAVADGATLVAEPEQRLTDLDALPFPDRRLVARHRHRYYCEYMKPLASIRTSKGCPFRCNFCALWKISGGRYLRRSPARIVEELAGIEEPFVFFADDESLVDAERMKTLARLIAEAGIAKRYFLYGRSDTIVRRPDLLEAWRDVGLERVFVGFEFFRDEDLAGIRKGSTTDDNARAAKILNDLGIDIYASFIVRPEFTTSDFAALRDYCRELDLSFASFAVLTPLPGTDLYAEVRDRLVTDDPAYFDFIHTLLPTALPLETFYREYHDLYAKAIPLKKSLAFLRKYPWREIPGVLATSRRVFRQLKAVHRDYPSLC